MLAKPKRPSLPKPSVFKNATTGQWVCEFYEFDDKGKLKAKRKSFVRDLKREGKEATLTEQRSAALAMQEAVLKEQKERERLIRREREQTYLTARQLREAKAAFAIFDQIPDRNKSLVDAVILYREHLKLAQDSPYLDDCVNIFLARKQEAVENDHLSNETYKTLKKHLNPIVGHLNGSDARVKIGDVTAKMLIRFFDSLDVGVRTRRNYITSANTFFNDASNPKDEHRFIDKNPMDGVYVHYQKSNGAKSLKTTSSQRKTPKILQLEESKRALQVAYEQREYGILGFAVCGLFLGMRPSEVFDLVKQQDYWERFVKLDEGIVRVDGFGKMRDQRIIQIPENAKEWLRLIRDNDWPLCFKYDPDGDNTRYANFRALAYLPEGDGQHYIDLRRARKRGVKKTKAEKEFSESCRKKLLEYQDVLRHTCGTNLYYNSGFDKNHTIEQLGHSADVFVEHYRGLLDHPDDHTAYFAQTPGFCLPK
ncbi:tyrosine-type recombinase/integrase [Cerasicoccus fimbriatus]|uniref:tyrosine-type recombinase/integrase n=1 Tax=Cerasicoccus fimbriatus TaxID=3014554 RepID=UPI0022B5A4AC|nr:tyrosine-type recombinase/integrase [Cerasicoccus sp. TK19100]